MFFSMGHEKNWGGTKIEHSGYENNKKTAFVFSR